ncbi:MAG TPA: cytochrome c oxidase subunit 3 [Acidobacteriota bacterium]|nr:cytochrome c oxidase subunit 3 [Acidobacteriota bacterium]
MASEEVMHAQNTGTHEMPRNLSAWEGGTAPYAIVSKKLGMWLFIISDAITFASLLVAYSYVRMASPQWPTPFRLWPSIANATLMTIVLLSSSLTMVMAVRSAKTGKRAGVVRWLLATAVGGVAFIVLHAREWIGLIDEGVRLFRNPWGTPLFGGAFFTLTGLHMTHVGIGVIYLSIIAVGQARRKFKPEDVEISGLYWHFVDLVWMFIFPLVYLMSARSS